MTVRMLFMMLSPGAVCINCFKVYIWPLLRAARENLHILSGLIPELYECQMNFYIAREDEGEGIESTIIGFLFLDRRLCVLNA